MSTPARALAPWLLVAGLVACGGTTTGGAGTAGALPSSGGAGGAGGGTITATGGAGGQPSTTSSTTSVTTGSTSTQPPACTDCIATPVSWGPSGGLVAVVVSSSLSTCRAYHYQQTSQGTGETTSCDAMLGACDASAISIGDVENAIANPDVQAALAGSTDLYGSDPRPCDGSVTQIGIGSRTLFVGGSCANGGCSGPDPKCVPVPGGLQALAGLLDALDKQQLAMGDCAGKFP